MITILDYGSGNLRSAERAFATTSREVIVTSDPRVCEKAEGLVIPGVGAFAACMNQLRAINGGEIIKSHIAAGKKILGICVGMQILFSKGFEKITSQGLGILKGDVELLPARILPHIGWNQVETGENSTLFKGIEILKVIPPPAEQIAADIGKKPKARPFSNTSPNRRDRRR